MSPPSPARPPRPRRFPVAPVSAAVVLMALLLMVQMWLLTATLEAYLGGDEAAAVPGAIFSGLLFAGVGALYLLVVRLDARARRER